MRSFVLALTKWFPGLLEAKPKESSEPINDENAEQQNPSDPESDDEEGAGDANDTHWQRLEKLRDKFEKLRRQNDEALEQKREKQTWRPVPDEEKKEPPKLIKCVHRILERFVLIFDNLS
jgi:flagellar motility protein MotE (MotC chaperone)